MAGRQEMDVFDAVSATVAAKALGVRSVELKVLAQRKLIPYHCVPYLAKRGFRIDELRSFAPLMHLVLELRKDMPVGHNCTKEQYESLLKRQNGVCVVCGNLPGDPMRRSERTPRLVVDHDHITGQVRGLLCSSCNTGIGHLGDSIELLERALEYLRNAAKNPPFAQ